ncbi:MAG: hypothetical protein AB7G06_02725 [Bdellovibrionales bacterium]
MATGKQKNVAKELGVTPSGAGPNWPPYDETPIVVPIKRIRRRAEVFQFKGNANKDGQNGHMDNVQHFETAFSGTTVFWLPKKEERKALERRIYDVPDSHQRSYLSERLKLSRQGQPIHLIGWQLKESDGWTEAKARLFAAYKNIAEGGETTTAVDVARLLRQIGDPAELAFWTGFLPEYLPIKNECLSHGIALIKLGEEAFDLIRSGTAKVEWGVYIAQKYQSTPDSDNDRLQADLLSVLIQTKPRSADAMVEIIEDTVIAGFFEEKEPDLFGEVADSNLRAYNRALTVQRAHLFRNVVSTLRQEQKVAAGMMKKRIAMRLQPQASPQECRRMADEAAMMETLLRKSARHAGHAICDTLSAQARRVKQNDVSLQAASESVIAVLRDELAKYQQNPANDPEDLLLRQGPSQDPIQKPLAYH